MDLSGLKFIEVAIAKPALLPKWPGQAIIVIEDIHTGLCSVMTSTSVYEGTKLIRQGRVGKAFKALYPENTIDHLRVKVLVNNSVSHSFFNTAKYAIEVSLLDKWVDKERQAGRINEVREYVQKLSGVRELEFAKSYPAAYKLIKAK